MLMQGTHELATATKPTLTMLSKDSPLLRLQAARYRLDFGREIKNVG